MTKDTKMSSSDASRIQSSQVDLPPFLPPTLLFISL